MTADTPGDRSVQVAAAEVRPWEEHPALAAARQAFHRHGYEAAIALGMEAVGRAGTGDERLGACTDSLLADCYYALDRYEESLTCSLSAVRAWHLLGETAAESVLRTVLARVLDLAGDPSDALEESLTALELADLSGDLYARMLALNAVGIVHLTLEDYDLAIRYIERAAETARLRKDEVAHAARLDTLACVYVCMAQAARAAGREPDTRRFGATAVDLSAEAEAVLRRHGRRRARSIVVGNLAEGLALAGRPAEALDVLDEWTLQADDDPTSIRAHHLDVRGSVCMAIGRHEEAVDLFRTALELSPSPNQAMPIAQHLSEAHEALGDVTAALAQYKRFHQLFRQVAAQAARRSASVAEIRLETARARDAAAREQARAEELRNLNEDLLERAEQLLRQSLEDPLTGLANRRWLDRTLEGGAPVTAVALLDIDHFKRINDRHSHAAGDEVLRRVGRLLARLCTAIGASAARYGGEEFVLLLHDGAPDAGRAFLEGLRQRIAGQPWDEVAPGIAVTLSVGLARTDEAGGVQGALDLADARLYEAKAGGRDLLVGPAGAPRPAAARRRAAAPHRAAPRLTPPRP